MFVKSFHTDKRFAQILLIDLVYYLLVGIIFTLFLRKVLPYLWQIKDSFANIATDQSIEELSRIGQLLQSKYKILLTLTILLLCLTLIVYTLCKAFIWAKLQKKKLTLKITLTYLVVNLIIIASDLIIYKLFSLILNDLFKTVLIILQIVITIYLINIVHPFIMMSKHHIKNPFIAPFKLLWEAIKYSVIRLPRYIIPAIMMFAVSYIMLLTFKIFMHLPYNFYLGIISLMTIIYLNWTKLYFKILIENEYPKNI